MRVYLAARYGRRLELLEYARQLEAYGYEVTSRWLNGSHEMPAQGLSEAYPAHIRRRYAVEDWEDLENAEVVISFTEPPGPVPGRARGGRHVEFGAAVAWGKRCIVVGHRENVFHHLPEVEFFETWAEAKHVLIGGADKPNTEVASRGHEDR